MDSGNPDFMYQINIKKCVIPSTSMKKDLTEAFSENASLSQQYVFRDSWT
jgi:hypothetical protein